MRKLLLISPILISFHIDAQDKLADSLRYCAARERDTIRINCLIALAQRMRGSDPTEAELFFKQAYEESVKLDFMRGQVRSLNGMGILYGMKGEYPAALANFKRALSVNLDHNRLVGIADSYSNIGIVYKRLGQYPISLEQYRMALPVYQRIGDYKGIAAVYQNMGVLHDLMQEHDAAYELYQKAYAIEDSIGNQRGVAIVTGYIGVYHFKKRNYTEARKYFDEFLGQSIELGDKYFIGDAHQNLGRLRFTLGETEAAREHLLNALDIYKVMKNREGIVVASSTLAEVEIAVRNYGLAHQYAQDALEATKSLGSLQHVADVNKLLSKIYEAEGKYPKALEYHKIFLSYKDSLFNQDKVTQFKAQQVQFEVQEKDRELADQRSAMLLLTREVEWKQQWLVMLSSLIALLSALMLLLFIRYRERKRSEEQLSKMNTLIRNQKNEIEALNADLEKRMLRAQMNPHFIFNALSSIQHFITINDRASSLKYLGRFSQLLRQVLETSMDVNVLLSEEITLLNIYVELESLRFSEEFTYRIEVDPNLDPASIEVPVLLFQPFVENAIVHGLMPKSEARTLSIFFADDGDAITCTITDNGVGRNSGKQKSGHKSRGMSVTNQRLALLERNRGVKPRILVEDLVLPDGTPAGTQVRITIPKT